MAIPRRHFRRIEAPQGAGTLHDGARLVASVKYGLLVLQEIIGASHWTGSSASKGALRVSGRFSVTGGNLPYEGDHLTLRLADGRDLTVLVVGSGPEYTIDATGALPRVDLELVAP